MSSSARKGDLATLKNAEEEANKIIAAARDERKVNMRDALREADREVEEYRIVREGNLKRTSTEAEQLARRVEKTKAETEIKLRQIDAEYASNKDAVNQLLLNVVLNIENPYVKK